MKKLRSHLYCPVALFQYAALCSAMLPYINTTCNSTACVFVSVFLSAELSVIIHTALFRIRKFICTPTIVLCLSKGSRRLISGVACFNWPNMSSLSPNCSEISRLPKLIFRLECFDIYLFYLLRAHLRIVRQLNWVVAGMWELHHVAEKVFFLSSPCQLTLIFTLFFFFPTIHSDASKGRRKDERNKCQMSGLGKEWTTNLHTTNLSIQSHHAISTAHKRKVQ